MELWFILAFVPGILWGVINVFDKVFVDKYFKDIYSFFFFYNIISPFVLIAFILLFGFQLIDLKYIIIAFFSALAYFGTNFFYIKALECDEISKVVPVYSTAVIFVLLYDIFIFKEDIKLLSVSGIILIILGSMFLLSKDLSFNIFKPRKVLFYMLASSLIWSLVFIFTKLFLDGYDFGTFLIYQLFFQISIGLSFLFFKKSRTKISNTYHKIKEPKSYFYIGIAEILDLGALFTLQFALTIGISSYVIAIGQVQYIFVLIFSTLLSLYYPKLLKEELSNSILLRKLFFIMLIIIGVILIKLNV